MELLKIFSWMFAIAMIIVFGAVAVLGTSASLFFMLTAYPIVTMVMLAIFAFCVVIAIAFWLMDREEKK
jgi:hypothetical protein